MFEVFLFYFVLFIYLVYLYKKGLLDLSEFPFILVKSSFLKNAIENFYFRHKRLVVALEKIIIYSSVIFFPLTITFFFELISKLVDFFKTAGKEKVASLVLPGIKTSHFYLPLVEGVLAILLMALLHEFFHGIIALKNKIRIKSAGFGFFLVFPLAYVELDEEKLLKIKLSSALAILLAGSFINLASGFLALKAFSLLESHKHAFLSNFGKFEVVVVKTIPNTSAWESNITSGEVIRKVNGQPVNTLAQLREVLQSAKEKGWVVIETNRTKYNLTFKNVSGRLLVGIVVAEEYKPKIGLVYSIYSFLERFLYYFGLLSVNVGFINLFPLFITDGQKMLDLILIKYNLQSMLPLSRLASLLMFALLMLAAIVGTIL